MSAQINLYDPRFLKQRDLLTLGKITLVAVALFAVLAAWAGWAWLDAANRSDDAASAQAQLTAAKAQVEAETQAAAIRKPNPRFTAEVESAEALLKRRGEIAVLLESGAVGSSRGFADFLRGFARQTPDGLWLTGFTIGAGGNDMEIRGSMLNPAALPDYIRRLGNEQVFQGRNFAALTMNRPDSTANRAGAPNAAVSPAPTITGSNATPRPIDFVLLPKLVDAREAKP